MLYSSPICSGYLDCFQCFLFTQFCEHSCYLSLYIHMGFSRIINRSRISGSLGRCIFNFIKFCKNYSLKFIYSILNKNKSLYPFVWYVTYVNVSEVVNQRLHFSWNITHPFKPSPCIWFVEPGSWFKIEIGMCSYLCELLQKSN